MFEDRPPVTKSLRFRSKDVIASQNLEEVITNQASHGNTETHSQKKGG